LGGRFFGWGLSFGRWVLNLEKYYIIKMKLKKDEICEIFNVSRCKKVEITSSKGKFNVYLSGGDSPAKVLFGKIIITQDFLRLFSEKEQLSILFHEKYHTKFSSGIKYLLNVIRFFSFRKAQRQEEFDADKYSAKICGKAGVLAYLKKMQKLYKNKTMEYNPKTHPAIEERIKRIERNRFL